MKTYRLFDVLGPNMIGPSSSHTAGAVKLGQVARAMTDEAIVKVDFYLHGSFAATYRGHGTDRALLAGLMGFPTWSSDIKDALFIAREKGIVFNFIPTDLGDVHPNTVRTEITTESGKKLSITGSSIGGGSVRIIEINRDAVDFTGDYPTLIIKYTDVPGMIAKVSNELYEDNINIAFLKVFRASKGRGATMVFETDQPVPHRVIEEIYDVAGVDLVSSLNLEG